MKKLILAALLTLALLSTCLHSPFATNTASAEAAFEDPFRCDPYRFYFDFPQDTPYDSIQYSMLVRSASKLDQTITVSMWPDYTSELALACSEWFTITPSTAILPSDSVAAFTIICQPPASTITTNGTYRTYLKVETLFPDHTIWNRPLTVVVRSGTSVPIVNYDLGEGFKIAQITGNEGTPYTQDQITILVNNKGNTANEFVLYPIDAQPSSSGLTTPDPNTIGDYRQLQELWRNPLSLLVQAEPKPNSYQSSTKHSSEYRLYTLNPTDNTQVEFGTFLGAAYDRKLDTPPTLAYPYQIPASKSADIPFTLRVNKSVPTGTYCLQIQVDPCGISTANINAISMGTRYACCIVVQVTRTAASPLSTSRTIPIILLGSLALLATYFGLMAGYRKLKTRRLQARQASIHNLTATSRLIANGNGKRKATIK